MLILNIESLSTNIVDDLFFSRLVIENNDLKPRFMVLRVLSLIKSTIVPLNLDPKI